MMTHRPTKHRLRILLNALTALSLILCVATVLLWLRSYSPHPPPKMYGDHRFYDRGFGASYRGALTLVHYNPEHGRDRPFDELSWRLHDFELSRWQGGNGWNSGWQYTSVGAPCWAVCLVTAILPILWVYRRRKQPFRPGLCPTCGYDLRATPDRCPECGTIRPEKGRDPKR